MTEAAVSHPRMVMMMMPIVMAVLMIMSYRFVMMPMFVPFGEEK